MLTTKYSNGSHNFTRKYATPNFKRSGQLIKCLPVGIIERTTIMGKIPVRRARTIPCPFARRATFKGKSM
jgi:hypothetical protein